MSDGKVFHPVKFHNFIVGKSEWDPKENQPRFHDDKKGQEVLVELKTYFVDAAKDINVPFKPETLECDGHGIFRLGVKKVDLLMLVITALQALEAEGDPVAKAMLETKTKVLREQREGQNK